MNKNILEEIHDEKYESSMNKRIVIVGNDDITHIGHHFFKAAQALGLETKICDVKKAFRGTWILCKINWWLFEHRPVYLREFSEEIINVCRQFRTNKLVSIGIAPIDFQALNELKSMGVRRLNYLTDNPLNPQHRAPWFMKTLPEYDSIFSTRYANMEELKLLKCKKVYHLPFAYSPDIHYPQGPSTDEEKERYNCDVIFIGGADSDRLPYITALIKAGFLIRLYGNYWERFKITKKCTYGHADPETMRKSISSAKIALCFVRSANKDDNSMRTFEIPAIGSCMLVEDTGFHRKIFGNEGTCVLYFKTIGEMVNKVQVLLKNDEKRRQMAGACHHLIISGHNTYLDRLHTMIEAG